MILNEDGDKCSAKELAQDIMLDCLSVIDEWVERNEQSLDRMTEREVSLLNDQLAKLYKRAAKAMGVADRVVERDSNLDKVKDDS